MKLKIDINLNHTPKKLNKNNKNKNQPHASHTSHVTTKNMSHATMQKYEQCNYPKIRVMQPCKPCRNVYR